MKLTIDLRSAFLGLGAGVAVIVLLGAAGAPMPATGRYQVVMGSEDVGLIIDTTTGQVWKHRSLSAPSSDGVFYKPKQ